MRLGSPPREAAVGSAPRGAGRRPSTWPLALAALAAFALSAASCAESPPRLVSTSYRLIFAAIDEAGTVGERLSAFASVSDGDGVDDIEALYVVSDSAELSWTLDADSWTRRDDGAAVWLGSNELEAQDGLIPRGRYRMIIVDKGGKRSETEFALRAPPSPAYPPPRARVESGSLIVASGYAVNTALFTDPGGNVVGSVPVRAGRNELSELAKGAAWLGSASHVSVYGYDAKSETGGLSWKTRMAK